MKSIHLASLCFGSAKPYNGIFQVPSQATLFRLTPKTAPPKVSKNLFGVCVKYPGWFNCHNLYSGILLSRFGMALEIAS